MLVNLIIPGSPRDLLGNTVDDREKKDKAGKRRQSLMAKSHSWEMRNCGRS